MTWQIDKERTVDPQQGRDAERAVALDLREADGRKHQITVEYVEGAPSVSGWRVVQPYLDDAAPPRRLLVDRAGTISIAQ